MNFWTLLLLQIFCWVIAGYALDNHNITLGLPFLMVGLLYFFVVIKKYS